MLNDHLPEHGFVVHIVPIVIPWFNVLIVFISSLVPLSILSVSLCVIGIFVHYMFKHDNRTKTMVAVGFCFLPLTLIWLKIFLQEHFEIIDYKSTIICKPFYGVEEFSKLSETTVWKLLPVSFCICVLVPEMIWLVCYDSFKKPENAAHDPRHREVPDDDGNRAVENHELTSHFNMALSIIVTITLLWSLFCNDQL